MKGKIYDFIQFVFLFGWVCYFFGHRKRISDWRLHLNKDDILGHGAYRVNPDGIVLALDPKQRTPVEVTPAEVCKMREHRICLLCHKRTDSLQYDNLDEFRRGLVESLLERRCYNPWYLTGPDCRTMILESVPGDRVWLEKQQ